MNIQKRTRFDQISQNTTIVLGMLCFAFLLRSFLCLQTPGHPTDAGCFASWSDLVVEHGPQGFYTAGFFADYPPGSMYFLLISGWVNRLFGLQYSSVGLYIVMLFAIAADLALAYLAYALGKKTQNSKVGLLACALIAFSPVLIYNSAVWKQFDSILTLALVGVFMLLHKDKKLLASILFGFAVAIKPQALMLGPVFAIAFLVPLFHKKTAGKAIVQILYCAIASIAVIWVVSVPFIGSQSKLFVFEKLFTTANSYRYATVNAANLFALVGGNWVADDVLVGWLTYYQWGMTLLGISTLALGYFAYQAQKNKALNYFLLGAFYLAAVFCFAPNMHERYMFAVPVLLVFSYVGLRNVRLLIGYGLFSVAILLNSVLSLHGAFHTDFAQTGQYELFLGAIALLGLIAFGYLCAQCYRIFVKGETLPVVVKQLQDKPLPIKKAPFTKRAWSKKDTVLCAVLCIAYAVLALFQLGTTKVPQNFQMLTDAIVEFDQPVHVSQIWTYGGISDSQMQVYNAEADLLCEIPVNYDVMFRWNVTDVDFTTDSVLLSANNAWVNELIFVDENGAVVQPAQTNLPALFDEPDTLPARPDRLNGMYFDELYHARTAYEYQNGLEPYENSHPPLGKLFIGLGIAIFGMNPLGWRIMGAIFSVLALLALYILAKQVCRKSWYAFFVSALFAFDFMHFVQSRMAVIDIYAITFILLAYYFMLNYYRMDFYADGLKKTLRPLALCGICFGLASACKWTGIYSGLGLAVLFFCSLFARGMQYYIRRRDNAVFIPYCIKTLLWCVLWFVIVPLGIYMFSYVLSGDTSLGAIWERQKYMFGYHSQLEATHPFSSTWWTWGFDLRPVWLYMGERLPQGVVQSIATFGNPIVWWGGLVGIVLLIANKFLAKADKTATFVLIGFASQYVPWMFISRTLFIYHYFAASVFAILALGYALEWLEGYSKKVRYISYAVLALSAICFAVFYPVLAGVPIPTAYAKALMWLDSWGFFIL